MDDIAELERRITAALMRIDRGLDGLYRVAAAPASDDQSAGGVGAESDQVQRLNDALEEERTVTAQLQERLRALREKEAGQTMPLQAEIDRLTKQLDVQGLEMQRLKKTVGSLREQLRTMTDALAEDRVEPHLINKAMLTELEALRALRSADAAELEEIILALDPLAAPAAKEGADADA
ncbi:hypothetical protein ACSBLW_03410 [Thioclava sp. FR2]|uniref:hypothetical protein n=1 Tax=Thioclava sp. FR2 TaxID=3445780 RepID=UPI003EBCCBF2